MVDRGRTMFWLMSHAARSSISRQAPYGQCTVGHHHGLKGRRLCGGVEVEPAMGMSRVLYISMTIDEGGPSGPCTASGHGDE